MGWIALGFAAVGILVGGITAVEIHAERHLPVDFPE